MPRSADLLLRSLPCCPQACEGAKAAWDLVAHPRPGALVPSGENLLPGWDKGTGVGMATGAQPCCPAAARGSPLPSFLPPPPNLPVTFRTMRPARMVTFLSSPCHQGPPGTLCVWLVLLLPRGWCDVLSHLPLKLWSSGHAFIPILLFFTPKLSPGQPHGCCSPPPPWLRVTAGAFHALTALSGAGIPPHSPK